MSAVMTAGWGRREEGGLSSRSRWHPTDGRDDRMDRANREIRVALDRGRRRRLVQSQKRRCLSAIDDCLFKLEELHVKGVHIGRRDRCRKVVAELVSQACEEAPEDVQTARTSYDLHSALLNWESAVLDALVPRRRELFPDLNQRDDWPRPRRPRRRRRPGAAQGALTPAV
ncbi:MAG: hypothetical protein WBF51_00895 [Candidatus Dormiibacterota bacterium]